MPYEITKISKNISHSSNPSHIYADATRTLLRRSTLTRTKLYYVLWPGEQRYYLKNQAQSTRRWGSS